MSSDRSELVNGVKSILNHTGFFIADLHSAPSISFDLIARRDDVLLIIKILTNIDSFNRVSAHNLKTLAKFLDAFPILVGEHSGVSEIEDGIVYMRYEVPIISRVTLKEWFIDGLPPFGYAAPGGIFVEIDGTKLSKLRHEKRVSLKDLAEAAGVSKKAIQMYEEGMGGTVDAALRLEEYLDTPLILPREFLLKEFELELEIEKLRRKEEEATFLEREIFSMLDRIGYEVLPTSKCPFDALSRDKKVILLTGISNKERNLKRKGKVLFQISRITERHGVIFVEDFERINIEGTALIKKKELKKTVGPEEILDMILEREK